jgi:hypothetical protein
MPTLSEIHADYAKRLTGNWYIPFTREMAEVVDALKARMVAAEYGDVRNPACPEPLKAKSFSERFTTECNGRGDFNNILGDMAKFVDWLKAEYDARSSIEAQLRAQTLDSDVQQEVLRRGPGRPRKTA